MRPTPQGSAAPPGPLVLGRCTLVLLTAREGLPSDFCMAARDVRRPQVPWVKLASWILHHEAFFQGGQRIS